MPDNKEKPSEQSSNHQEDKMPSRKNQQLGSRILTQVGYENRHKEIVESSFNKARKRGEKLLGKNNERRNYAYLSRLEKLIDKYGNDGEKRLWQKSINNDLLVKYEDIPESYWNSKRQELRDNGDGSVELTESLKHKYYEKERELQKGSLEKWANYLGDEHSPYPLWFKVYAWDGMTKMGRYNKEKGKYETRNESTVAPYPNPDAEVLARVFDVVNHYHGNNEREFYTEEGERNIKLEQIVQSGSFPKIFNAIQQDIAPIIEPPEKAEDVHGEWLEYGLGDEDDIARAARGTGWCVASSSVGRHYLEYGTYGHDDEYNDIGNIEENNSNQQNHAKFILFHLKDEKTGKLAKNACASIRLDPDGQVAEISGLKVGQALDDSLVSTVEKKVKSLPNGEKFLEAFADKNRLITLDRKMKNKQDLSKDDLEFLYEIHKPIKTLDTYNSYDPRIDELKQQYGIEYALDNGVDINQLVSNLDSYDIINNLDTLINHGANNSQLTSNLHSDDIVRNLDTLINHGVDINIDQLVSNLGTYDIAKNLDTLINHGANIDRLVSNLDSCDIINNLDTLINHGANIDQLVSNLGSHKIIKNLDTLINHGANIDRLVSNLRSHKIAKNLDTLINHGANIDQLVSNLDSDDIANNLDTLINHGANI